MDIEQKKIDTEYMVRLNKIIAPDGPLPISRSQWHAGVKKGYYPQSKKLGPNISAWLWSDIEGLMANGFNQESSSKLGGANE